MATNGPEVRRWLWGLFACYALLTLTCLQLRPLWMDEIIQLIVNNSRTIPDFIRTIGPNPGASPLGYITQRPFLLAGPTSPLWARLPSVLFSILSCWLVAQLCKQLKIPHVTPLAVGLFMVLPLQFRYALEARPYSEALCFSLLAMLAFLKLPAGPSVSSRGHSLRLGCLCILATTAAVYTQPYAILNVGGMIFWTALTNVKARHWKRAALGPACLLVSLLAYLPWYFLQTPRWASGIQEQGFPPFHWTLSLIQDVLKSMSGDGYLCSIALILLAAAAFLSRSDSGAPLLLSTVLFTLFGALAGDAWMNYFFASRQILFAIPGLAILAALGCTELYRRNRIVALAAMALLVGAAVEKNVTMETDAKENWPAAAGAVADVARDGRCLEVVPAYSFAVYVFFAPDLKTKVCAATPQASGVALVSHFYTTPADLTAAESHLRQQGFVAGRTIAVGGTKITLEERKQ